MNPIQSKIVEILSEGCEKYDHPEFHISKITDGYQIKYGQEYTPPKLNFDVLIKLSELFGTQDINVDNYSVSGCETCDYGSDYGHEIAIKHLTKNEEMLSHLVGKTF